jgi:hypothetical protein
VAAPQAVLLESVIAPAGAGSAAPEQAAAPERVVGAGFGAGAGNPPAPAPTGAGRIEVPAGREMPHGAALRMHAGQDSSGSAPGKLTSAAVARGTPSVAPAAGASADFGGAERHDIVPNAQSTFIPGANPEPDAGLADLGAPRPAPVQLRDAEDGAWRETTAGLVRTLFAGLHAAPADRVPLSGFPGGGEPRVSAPPKLPDKGQATASARAPNAPAYTAAPVARNHASADPRAQSAPRVPEHFQAGYEAATSPRALNAPGLGTSFPAPTPASARPHALNAPAPETPDRAVASAAVPTRKTVVAASAPAGAGHPEPEPLPPANPEQRLGTSPPVAGLFAAEGAAKAALTRPATPDTAPATEPGATATADEAYRRVAVQAPAAPPMTTAAPPPGPADSPELAPPARHRAPDATEALALPESLPAPAPVAPPAHAGTTAAAELVPAISRQIAQVAFHAPDGPVELTLSPEELGRVRLTLATTDGGISVSVQAERPETLDLIRRNIEHLARDFRDLGYSSTAFTFGDRPHNGQADTQARAQAPQPVPEFPQPHTALQSGSPASTGPTPVAAGGLDLRL